MNGKEKILDQLKNNHQQCQNRVLARGWLLRQRSGEIELTVKACRSPVDLKRNRDIIRHTILISEKQTRVFLMTFDSGFKDLWFSLYNAIWARLLNVYGAQESIPRNEFRQPM